MRCWSYSSTCNQHDHTLSCGVFKVSLLPHSMHRRANAARHARTKNAASPAALLQPLLHAPARRTCPKRRGSGGRRPPTRGSRLATVIPINRHSRRYDSIRTASRVPLLYFAHADLGPPLPLRCGSQTGTCARTCMCGLLPVYIQAQRIRK